MINFDDIEFASLTDVGMRRSHNQDSHAVLPASDGEQWQARGHVFMVADGMGAHAVGELASKLAADNIPHIYQKHADQGPVLALRKAFLEANTAIHTRGQANREFQGMGTTATAVVLKPDGAWVGHVGDSRAYRVRGDRIEQLSFDHSLVWELARRQKKDPDELTGVPSNVIVRSLGPESLVQIDVEGPHPLEPGDAFVLCSDGLSGPLSDREIGAVVSSLPPEQACRFLIHLANLQGGPDNITAVIIRVKEGTHPAAAAEPLSSDAPDPNRRRWFHYIPWALFALFLGILLAIVAIYLTYYRLGQELIVFMLAALCLLGGVIGLIVQHAREESQQESLSRRQPPRIYRQTNCTVDASYVERIRQAAEALESRLRDSQRPLGNDRYERFVEHGREAEEREDYNAAFRNYCLALLEVMEVLDRYRSKEEAFQPLFDRPPGLGNHKPPP